MAQTISNYALPLNFGYIGFSVATTNYIKSYGKQSAVPTMSQVLKSFKQGWIKRVARITFRLRLNN